MSEQVKMEKDKEAQINVRKFHIVERNGEPYIRREPYVYDIPEGKGLQILGHAYFANLASTAYDLKVGKLKEGDLPPAAEAVRNLMKPLPTPPKILRLSAIETEYLNSKLREYNLKRMLRGDSSVSLSDICSKRDIFISPTENDFKKLLGEYRSWVEAEADVKELAKELVKKRVAIAR